MLKLFKSFVKPNTAKRFTQNFAQSFTKDTGGNVAMMFGVSLFALVGGLAVAIDLSNGFAAKQRLQNTTDAIALLAARDGIEDAGELEAAAQAYFDQAYPGANGQRIEVLNITRDGDRIDIETRNNIDTVFAPFLGRNDLDVSVKSSSTFAKQSLDVALVLDTTGSMQGAKLASLKTSATRLMDTLDGFDNDELRVSIIPFAQYVNVGRSQRNQPWVDATGTAGTELCVGSRIGGLNTQVEAGGNAVPTISDADCGIRSQPAEIMPLTNDFRALKRTITDFTADGFTYAPAGLMWGWRTLDERAPFTQAASSVNGKKVLVLMTDGANTRSVSGSTHNGRSRQAADTATADICNRVKDSDIEVYTIAFELNDTATRNLLRNCASSTANFFDAHSAGDLDAAFTNISATLNELRITS